MGFVWFEWGIGKMLESPTDIPGITEYSQTVYSNLKPSSGC